MKQTILVWDIAIRVFHWSLVLALVFLWFSGSQHLWLEYHPLVGYWVLALIAWRILWGFIGTHFARFSSFVGSPFATWRAIPSVFGRQRRHYLAHNPLGAYMVLLMLGAIMFQGLTGLGSSDDILIDGPLVEFLSSYWVSKFTLWHHRNGNFLLVLVSLHLIAVVFHDVVQREGLTAAMFSGKKYGSQLQPAQAMPWLRLLITLLIIFGALFYWFFHLP